MMTDLFMTVLEVSASASLVVLLLLLLSPLLNRRYASKWKYLVWIFLAVRLLILSDGTDGRSVVDMTLGWKERIVSKVEQSEADIVSTEPVPRRLVVEIPAQMTVPFKAQGPKNITPLDICAFLWAAGSLLFMVVHIASYLHYKRRVMKNGKPLKEAAVLEQLLELKRELHIRHIVPVIEFSEAASPMLLGFFRPVLVLPDDEYSAEEMFFILKHELCYPQLVGTITLGSGRRSSKNIYEIFKNLPGWNRSVFDLLHFRDWFQIKMNFNRNVSCLIAVYFFMDNDFFNQPV